VQKRAPTLGNLLVIVVFVLACFGLLLFLWQSFGGPVPLRPKGYRFKVDFPNGLQLAEQSDVRISGVPVGRVVTVKQRGGQAQATLEIEPRYAPVRQNVHAILREMTLLGETFVQLIPRGNSGPFIADGGTLPSSHVEPTVTLDAVLSTFDPRTRQLFRQWQQTWAASFKERGEDINSFFASLEPWATVTGRIVRLLAAQEGAVTALVHNTGIVFRSLAGRDQQLKGLIEGGEQTFHALAQSSQQFAAAFRALPAFESSSRTALREIDSFQTVADPYYDQFRAVERQLAPTLRSLEAFAPPLQSYLSALGRWTRATKRGLPAFDRSLALTKPVLRELTPVLRNLNPFLRYLGEYEPELQAFFANATAATQGQVGNENVPGGVHQHYLAGLNLLGPESLAVYQEPVGTNRANPYFHPGAFSSLASGLQVFDSRFCADSAPAISGPANETVPEGLLKALRGEPFELETEPGKKQTFQISPVANKPGAPNQVAAPACTQQGPFVHNGVSSQFPQLTPEG
jgi:phospholipid/cholesterol/gamma-HCH transport system substrate-binding protein